MVPISSPPSRLQQRRVFGSLSALALLAVLQPLLLPRQPRLPLLPADAPLPAGWQPLEPNPSDNTARDTRSPALPPPPRPRGYRPMLSGMAVGSSVTLRGPEGQLLRLTPLASWSDSALDLATLDPQPAPDAAADAEPDQAETSLCLTPSGQLEGDHDSLIQLLFQADPLPANRRLLYILLPPPGRSFNCLLVTTTSSALLQESPASQRFWTELSGAVRWPPPPGH